MSDGWIDGNDALARLGVKPQTLYAYVSRGRVRARPHPDDPRRSLYSTDDLDRLSTHKARGRKGGAAAAAMDWGDPVLTSAITAISGGRLWFRGADAVRLAESESLEAVALRLWDCPEPDAFRREAHPRVRLKGPALARALAVLAARAGVDAPALGRSPAALWREGAGLMVDLAGALGEGVTDGPLHEILSGGWGLDPAGAELVRRALVLLADHELNASTFAARVAASTGSSLAAAVLAGMAALSGPRHGGAGAQVAALMADADRLGPDAALRGWMERGEPPAGFGHRLYPDGDPRAAALLAAFRPSSELLELKASGERLTGRLANVDFALAAMARSLALPQDAPFAMFAVGRSAGWIAHALEQLQGGQLIRPRARYTGLPPD